MKVKNEKGKTDNYALMSGLIGGMVLQYIQNHLYVKYLAGSPNFTTFFSWLVLWWNTKHKSIGILCKGNIESYHVGDIFYELAEKTNTI